MPYHAFLETMVLKVDTMLVEGNGHHSHGHPAREALDNRGLLKLIRCTLLDLIQLNAQYHHSLNAHHREDP